MIFFQSRGDAWYPTMRSRIRRACWALTLYSSIGCGWSKARSISLFVIALKTTRFAWEGSTPRMFARCHAIASPSRSRSVANQIWLAPLAALRRSVTVFFFSVRTS